MMRQERKTFLIVICALALICILMSSLLFSSIQLVFAAEQTDAEADFFSNANTYDAIVELKEVAKVNENDPVVYYQSVRYDMDHKRSGVMVSDDAPQVTFITHGLGGDASHWSNGSENGNWDFVPSSGSIFDLLQQKADCNLYLAIMDVENTLIGDKRVEKFSVKLYELEKDSYIYNEDNLLTSLTDNSKHSVIIFQAHNPSQSNDYVYTQFNIMASKVVSDLQALDPSHELPRVNLIGHSRGGLTNLQYALDHPDLVDSIFSMGTPYIGSTSASIDKHLLGGMFAKGPGEDDIVDPDIYLSYLNRWNTNYESLYSNISVHAIGAYQSFDMLVYEFIYRLLGSVADNEVADGLIRAGLKAINIYVGTKIALLPGNLGIPLAIRQQLCNFVVNVIYSIFPGIKQNDVLNGLTAVLDLLLGEVAYNIQYLSYDCYNDVLVDLPSQLGQDGQSSAQYKGFIRVEKRFSIFDETNLDRACVNNFPVTHNLETRDSEILSYIVKNIELSHNKNGTPYLVETVSEDSVKIVGYIGKNVSGTLSLPTKIYYEDLDGNAANNNKDVVAVGTKAFANNLNDESEINRIVIPNTVKQIDNYAFSYNTSLREIVLPNGLEQIGERAFWGAQNLETVALPNTVTEIGAFAFSGCSSMTGIMALPSSLSSIGAGAFLGCDSISSYSITSSNQSYSVSNGILYNKNKTELISYPEGKQTTSFTLPSSVASVGEYAVYGNDSLASINLNNATTIREYAFSNCANLVNIGANKVEYVGSGALEGTKWLDNAPDKVVIGKALYQYNGTASNLDLSGLYSISPFAVCDNANLQTVTMNNAARTIDTYAFFGCENLNTVYINNVNSIVYVGTGAFDATGENLTIYIPQRIANQYENNDLWQQYENELEVHSTYIDYELNGGEFSEADYNDSVEYGGYFSLPVPEKEGYSFKGWYDSSDFSGAPRAEGELWTEYDDTITLYAKWEILENVYTVTYKLNGGSMETITDTFTENDTFTYPIPERYGYVFQGWFYDSDFDQYAGTFCPTGVKENIVLYAKWVEQYYIDFRYGYSHDNPVFFIEEDLPLKLTSAERSGYRFMGWYTSSVFAPEYKVIEITEPQNIKLYAYWEKLYTVTFNTNGGSSVPSVQGIAGERIKLPSPTRYQYEGTWEAWGYLTKDVSVSNFGYSYTIERKDVTLDAIWRRVVYNVYFKNLASNMYVPTTTYRVGVGLNQLPNIVFRGAGAHGEDVPLSNFYGWYDSSDFSGEPVQSIGKSEARNITLYAKYDYLIKTAFKTGSSKVQDTGINQQPSYSFNVNMNMYYNYVKNTTLDTIKVTVSLTIWEDQDGYQDVYVYNGDQELAMKTFEHGEGVTNTKPGPHTHDFTFELNSYKDIDQLTIRFGAHGAFWDTWNFSDLEVRVYLTN